MASGTAKLMKGFGAAPRYVLTIIWVASGAAKLAGLSTFEAVLSNHGVLSDRAISWAWTVPAVEVVLGGTIFLVGRSKTYPRLRRVCAAGSSLLLGLFCIYVSRVPGEIFRTIGCGCQGAFGLTDLIGTPSRAATIGFNLVLVAMSLCLWPARAGERAETPRDQVK